MDVTFGHVQADIYKSLTKYVLQCTPLGFFPVEIPCPHVRQACCPWHLLLCSLASAITVLQTTSKLHGLT